MRTTDDMDAAIMEAKLIRARHDGVHLVHSYLAVLELCRELATQGAWGEYIDGMFDEAMMKMRHIERTGFAPKPTLSPVVRRLAPGSAAPSKLTTKSAKPSLATVVALNCAAAGATPER
jgi:hypothetical protein